MTAIPPKGQPKLPVRASISFPPDLYKSLEELAQQKKVSLAWVVRDAVEKYASSELKSSRESERL